MYFYCLKFSLREISKDSRNIKGSDRLAIVHSPAHHWLSFVLHRLTTGSLLFFTGSPQARYCSSPAHYLDKRIIRQSAEIYIPRHIVEVVNTETIKTKSTDVNNIQKSADVYIF